MPYKNIFWRKFRMKKIIGYRKIQSWENFFLDSAIYSIGQSLGIEYENGFHFISAITGDMFAYLYNKNKPSDSGITNYVFMPDAVKRAYAAFGYDCIYFSNDQIKNNFGQAMDSIKRSIDLNIPVLGWGIGNAKMRNGSCSLPEGCIIGGYDDNNNLFVNLYPGPERLAEGAVDADGYTLITNGLEATFGIFIIGKKIKQAELKEIYINSIDHIPFFLAHEDINGYSFGEKAFKNWSAELLDDTSFEGKTDEELSGICWDLHCSPYCCVCTMDSFKYIKQAAELFPDIKMAHKVLPFYEELNKNKDKIWGLHGGFFPPMQKFRTHEFRMEIAEILKTMGKICCEIKNTFENK
jgi:hypothetical protein